MFTIMTGEDEGKVMTCLSNGYVSILFICLPPNYLSLSTYLFSVFEKSEKRENDWKKKSRRKLAWWKGREEAECILTILCGRRRRRG